MFLEIFVALIMAIALVLGFIGILKPTLVKATSRKQAIVRYFGVFIVASFAFGFLADSNKDKQETTEIVEKEKAEVVKQEKSEIVEQKEVNQEQEIKQNTEKEVTTKEVYFNPPYAISPKQFIDTAQKLLDLTKLKWKIVHVDTEISKDEENKETKTYIYSLGQDSLFMLMTELGEDLISSVYVAVDKYLFIEKKDQNQNIGVIIMMQILEPNQLKGEYLKALDDLSSDSFLSTNSAFLGDTSLSMIQIGGVDFISAERIPQKKPLKPVN